MGLTNKSAVNGMSKSRIRELAPVNAFAFLTSDMASYISGVILSVDGLARA